MLGFSCIGEKITDLYKIQDKTYHFLLRYNHLLRERSGTVKEQEAKGWCTVRRHTEMLE